MIPRFLLLTLISSLFGLALSDGGGNGGYGGYGGTYGGGGGGGGDDDSASGQDNDDQTASTTSTPASATGSAGASTTSAPAVAQSNTSLLTGDTQCSQTMCIAATVNGTETTYVLSSLGKATFGWMAMGFGSTMANTPMVIMWINNGNAILSQRSAPSEVMPTVVANPPRTASLLQSLTSISSTTPSLAYTIPSNSDTQQTVIFAFGTVNPNSASPDATLQQHLDYGTLSLDLTKTISSSSTSSAAGSSATSAGTSSSDTSFSIPLQPYQKTIIAHAVLCTVGFLFFLPAGALLARYARTFVNNWFKGHWILQFGIAAPLIGVGIVLGILAVSQAKSPHLNDDHKRWGIALLVLYLVQCGLGAFIHFVKKADRKSRPPQNYLHAVVGIAIIGLALYQVHLGLFTEWPMTTGRDPLPSYVKVIFWIWAVLLPVSYAVGLAFLPKQYRQERAKVKTYATNNDDRDHLNLRQTSYQYKQASLR